MTFTIDDFRDLVRLLEERPEWRAELRRLVLSDEVLELPAVVRQLAERMDQLAERMERLAAAQARTEERVGRTEVRLSRVEAAIERLAEAEARTEQRLEQLAAAQVRTEDRLSRVEAAIERLVEAQGRTETRVGHLDGMMLELQYERLGPVYLSKMARRLRTVDRTRLADLLDDAVDEGRLSLEERDSIMRADVVFRGRRFEDDAEIYVLAEVSVGIGLHDVERASDRAAMLEKLGWPVLPVVGGRRIDAETLALARERGVWQSLEGQATPPLAS